MVTSSTGSIRPNIGSRLLMFSLLFFVQQRLWLDDNEFLIDLYHLFPYVYNISISAEPGMISYYKWHAIAPILDINFVSSILGTWKMIRIRFVLFPRIKIHRNVSRIPNVVLLPSQIPHDRSVMDCRTSKIGTNRFPRTWVVASFWFTIVTSIDHKHKKIERK